ncbi:MAG: prepilin-type N-terminal cleavage/methylation domain-containing protein [Gemmatimonadaceae bacterium]
MTDLNPYRLWYGMQRTTRGRGHTLVEVIIALLVFSVGGLALAASSAVVARAMSGNSERERAARIALSKLELIKSRCLTATNGSEVIEQMQVDWTVSHGPSLAIATASVRCLPPLKCAESYRAVLSCQA